MPVWSLEQKVRNNTADCLCFVLLIAGPEENSPSIAIGFAESCHQSPATHTAENKAQGLHLELKEVVSGMQVVLVDWQSHRRDTSKQFQF